MNLCVHNTNERRTRPGRSTATGGFSYVAGTLRVPSAISTKSSSDGSRATTARGACLLLNGFTLVELLVVIAIIGILVALLLPAIQAAREAARRTSCSNKLRQLGIALHNHHDTVGRFPIGNFLGKSSKPNLALLWGELPQLLPYMEETALHDVIDFTKSPNDIASGNLKAIQTPLPALSCPSSPYIGELGYQEFYNTNNNAQTTESDYATSIGDYKNNAAGMQGPGVPLVTTNHAGNNQVPPRGVMTRFGWAAKFKDIPDGTSKTFAFGESVGHWSINVDFPFQAFATTSFPINYKNDVYLQLGNIDYNNPTGLPANSTAVNVKWDWAITFRSMHPGGAHFLMCDASVSFLPDSIDHFTYMARASRAGGEIDGGGN
jgi:prepilin-type N-terminal cleavage/methylation domain-containing protein